MGGSTIASSDTRIEALSLQSSAYGVPLQILYGMNRVKGNLVWYGGFKATPVTSTQSSGGKGGSVKTTNTSYNYTASVLMGLCEGQITGVPRAWKGKQLYAGGALATSIATSSETYAVPASGAMVYTVSHAAAWLTVITVTQPYTYTQSSDSGDAVITGDQPLANGTDYTVSFGVLTILNTALRGITVTIKYQWASATINQTALQQLGLTFGVGALGQAVWSPLSTIAPAQALGYSGLGYVAGQDYQLGTAAQVDNHTFEVQGPQSYSISSTVPDANPALATYDLLTNARFGANFPSAQVAGVNDWSTYCLASNLLMSPLLETQMQAGDFVTQMAQLTNTAPVWSNGRLKMIPYGDTALTANGATFTPNVTPVWDLTDNDFTPSAGAEPIRVTRKAQADAYNNVKIEFLNRNNLYNIEIAEAKDSANIDAYGLRVMPTISAHWICSPVVARAVAQLVLQRVLYVRNTYQFALSWAKIFLEPMDLVTLTDSALGFSKLPVRITSVEESESGDLSFEAEDFPLGTANAATYQSQIGAGFQHDYNAAPGSVSAPIIFEAPGALTVNGLELYVAASSANVNWGGAHLWVSLDGTNYKQVGTLSGGSRYGALTNAPGTGGTISVQLISGTLTSGSAADATALNTLCFIGGTNKEYIAYQTATLTSALNYDLASSVRGAYGSPVASHSVADTFVRVDGAIAKSGPIDLGYIGKTVHVKLTSFNVYGGAEESLASVTDYTYAISGWQVLGNAGAAAVAGLTTIASDNVLSAGEKPTVILDVTTITAEQAGLDAQAVATFITTEKTTYDNALSTLTTYLATLTTPTLWSNVAGDTTIVGTTFRSNFANLYAARQALLNAIAARTGAQLTTRPNLLQNSTFEGGATNWTVNMPSGPSTFTYADSVWGRTAVAYTMPNGVGFFESAKIPAAAGVTYTITGDSVLFAASGDCYFDLQFYNSGGTLLLDGPSNSVNATHDFSVTDSNRATHAVAVVAPANTATMTARFVWNATSVTAVGCRQIKVERGALPATPYSAETGISNIGTIQLAPGAATVIGNSTTNGPVSVTTQSGTPDNFTRYTQIASLTLASGPAPELGSATIDVLVTVNASYSVSGSGSTQYLMGGLQNNASFNGFLTKDIDQAASGVSKAGQLSQSTRFTVAGNVAVTFGLWMNMIQASPQPTIKNIEMRAEVIKR